MIILNFIRSTLHLCTTMAYRSTLIGVVIIPLTSDYGDRFLEEKIKYKTKNQNKF